jgi:hypothetical protein
MFAMNHEEFMVIAANSSTITLDRPVSNLNIPLQPQMDVLKYPTVAFNNVSNLNAVRYYTTQMTHFDNYNIFQVKVVLLASDNFNVPKVDQIQAIAVSA